MTMAAGRSFELPTGQLPQLREGKHSFTAEHTSRHGWTSSDVYMLLQGLLLFTGFALAGLLEGLHMDGEVVRLKPVRRTLTTKPEQTFLSDPALVQDLPVHKPQVLFGDQERLQPSILIFDGQVQEAHGDKHIEESVDELAFSTRETVQIQVHLTA